MSPRMRIVLVHITGMLYVRGGFLKIFNQKTLGKLQSYPLKYIPIMFQFFALTFLPIFISCNGVPI